MRILVTGGSGFIAKVFIERLLQLGDEVVVFTRSGTKASRAPRRGLEVFRVDVSDAASLNGVPVGGNIDAVVHMAGSLDYFGDKTHLFRVNVGGTVNLLNWALERKVGKFIYTSSIEAIGVCTIGDIPMDESRAPRPLSSYGESKLAAETVVSDFGASNGVNTVILRLGNVYGPPSPAFIKPVAEAIAAGGSLLKYLPVYGGRYIHPVFIDDVVEGIVKAISGGRAGQVYILAGGEYVKISELFRLVAVDMGRIFDMSGAHAGLFDKIALAIRVGLCRMRKQADLPAYFAAGYGGSVHRAYSIVKAGRELGWHPVVSLTEGIARTLAALDGARGRSEAGQSNLNEKN